MSENEKKKKKRNLLWTIGEDWLQRYSPTSSHGSRSRSDGQDRCSYENRGLPFAEIRISGLPSIWSHGSSRIPSRLSGGLLISNGRLARCSDQSLIGATEVSPRSVYAIAAITLSLTLLKGKPSFFIQSSLVH